MTRVCKVIFASIILVLSFAAPLSAGPFEDAIAAQERGDRRTAIRLLLPFAEQGSAPAQARLGSAYEGEADYVEAAKWYRRAADQGHSVGQLFLSVLYAIGKGVPQDYVLAHMWANLAASTMSSPSLKDGYDEAIKRRHAAAANMTPAQIAEAQKLAREWKPTKQPPR